MLTIPASPVEINKGKIIKLKRLHDIWQISISEMFQETRISGGSINSSTKRADSDAVMGRRVSHPPVNHPPTEQ